MRINTLKTTGDNTLVIDGRAVVLLGIRGKEVRLGVIDKDVKLERTRTPKMDRREDDAVE